MDTDDVQQDEGTAPPGCAARGGRDAQAGAARRGGLTPRQEVAALRLAQGKNTAEAAAEVKVSRRTIQQWLSDVPGFKAKVAELRSALFSAVVGKLSSLAGHAADTLGLLLDDP